MNTLRQLVIAAFALFVIAPCLPAADDLLDKRNWLIYQMRALGPLAPTDWPYSGALDVYNSPGPATDITYHPQGGFAYVGSIGIEYFYRYAGPGYFFPGNPAFLNPTTRFDYFGLHEYKLDPYPFNYYFFMDSSSYNVAGLKYNSLLIIYNVNAAGDSIGWVRFPGQGHYPGPRFSATDVFDLAQNVETPAFKVADYWFGHYPNFPQDTKLPSQWGQDTANLTSGGFLLRNIHTLTTNLVWAQEGVYRPGLTLQPGYSTPRLYTYMQQYFSAAYRCDSVTGNLPRTGTLNWDGRGRINTASAITTGRLTGDGYYFQPNEFGKAVLATRAQENGSYGEIPVYTLGLLVDKNRDGTLNTNDVTTAASPHVFWVNNDSDRPVYEAKNLWDELDVDPATVGGTDADFVRTNFRIPSLRDLEDYDRLHIPGLRELCRDLPPGHTVTLSWKQILSGSPGIFVFGSVSPTGSKDYLTDSVEAGNQIQPTQYPTSTDGPGLSPLAVGRIESGVFATLHNDNYRCTNNFFIYCGTSRGAGELAVEVRKGGQLLGSVSVFLDIRDVKELFERWTLGETPEATPATVATLHGGGLPSGVSPTAFIGDNPAQPYILFVHGWNMSSLDKDAFAETAFKRLYWQGYTNRFGAFRWPTGAGFSDDLLVYPGPVFDSSHYDRSELIAWKSGEGLRSLLVNLNQRYPGKVQLLAHSMGNVVAGEALALQAEKYGGGQIVNTYVASQAAVPLQCYNASSPPVFNLLFEYKHPQAGVLGRQHESYTANVYPGWLETNRVSCFRRVNFYNSHDFALSQEAWQFNQIIKPDVSTPEKYGYARTFNQVVPRPGGRGVTTTPFVLPSPARRGLLPTAMRVLPGYFLASSTSYGPGGSLQYNLRVFDWQSNLNDMYEVMAFASEARTMPLGAAWDVNSLEARLTLWSVWPVDTEPHERLGTFGRHKWHSAQFRSNNMKQRLYWNTLIGQDGFQLVF